MKVRKVQKSANSKRLARQVARQDAEIADLKSQLAKALAIVNAQAEQIKTLISASVERVDGGSRLVGETGSTMREVVDSVERVTRIIGEISASSASQSLTLGEIGQAVRQLDQMTQQNAALVEESAAAAESLKDQSAQLVETVASFKLA